MSTASFYKSLVLESKNLTHLFLRCPSRCNAMSNCPSLALLFYQAACSGVVSSLYAADLEQEGKNEHRMQRGTNDIVDVSLRSPCVAQCIQSYLFCESPTDPRTQSSLREAVLDIGKPLRICDWIPWTACATVPSWIQRTEASATQILRVVCDLILLGSTEESAALGSSLTIASKRSSILRRVLYNVHLVSGTEDGTKNMPHRITKQGLQFCMMEDVDQWWEILKGVLVCVLDHPAVRDIKRSEEEVVLTVVQLLACLVYARPSEHVFDFTTLDDVKKLKETAESPQKIVQSVLLQAFLDVGLVCGVVSRDGTKKFAVSSALVLCLKKSFCTVNAQRTSMLREVPEENSVITETNFRLYAYTESEVLLSVLRQFSKLDVAIADGVYCFNLTRETFSRAVRQGLSAEQIIQFLTLRAHPCMKSKRQRNEGSSIVPQSICDQLRNWEADAQKVECIPSVFLQFASIDQCQQVRAEAVRGGHQIVFFQNNKAYLVVPPSTFDELIRKEIITDPNKKKSL